MRARTILIIVGVLVTAKLAATRRLHGAGHEHEHGPHCHGNHGPMAYLEQSEWRGLTEDEARSKLANRHDDDQSVDEAIEYLDEHGYLARLAETVES